MAKKKTLEELVAKAKSFGLSIEGLNKSQIHNAIQDRIAQKNLRFAAFLAKKMSDPSSLPKLSESQNHRCAYCGGQTYLGKTPPKGMNRFQHQATIEHVIPRSRGGSDEWENLVMACHECNNLRGNARSAIQFFNSLHDPKKWDDAKRRQVEQEEAAERAAIQRRENEKVASKECAALSRLIILFRFYPDEMLCVMSEISAKIDISSPRQPRVMNPFDARNRVLERIHGCR